MPRALESDRTARTPSARAASGPRNRVTPRTAAGVSTAKPFVKWVGGKRQLIAELEKYVPKPLSGTYFEPFVGGGALFFHLQPKRAVLSDSNERLIRAYRGIQTDVEGVIRLLRGYEKKHEKDFYLKVRANPVDDKSDAEVAAWFIYLNRTGYNGLYRVNSKGEFNVPFGDYKNPTICDANTLRACSTALQSAKLCLQDFGEVTKQAKKGDFVYFDPPYVPLSTTSDFTAYTRDGFGPKRQEQLRDVARELKRRGVVVLLSNSSAPLVHELYAKGFDKIEVGANRAVNCKPDGRGKVAELIIR